MVIRPKSIKIFPQEASATGIKEAKLTYKLNILLIHVYCSAIINFTKFLKVVVKDWYLSNEKRAYCYQNDEVFATERYYFLTNETNYEIQSIQF